MEIARKLREMTPGAEAFDRDLGAGRTRIAKLIELSARNL